MTAAPASAGFPALEKYELIEEIGHGGMATVYRARDPRLGREVAVKVIHKHLRENKEVATRFVAEARAAAKLRHPGIVEVFDVSNEDDGERYLVVELLRGTTLRKVLLQNREMPAEVGAAIVLELCEALEAAHAGSVIHRDVKPENVLVELPGDRVSVPSAAEAPRSGPASDPKASSKRGGKAADPGVVIKITDFGIAKILDAQGVTSTGQVLGSPAHMAPEQIEGGEVDARTDVFALGVLMYECLVGHLPFEGKNPAQVLRRVLDGTYAPADRERATVGGRWSKILARALSREAEGRTKSPGVLGEEIQAELAALGIGDPKAEISAYFADPGGYTKALEQRLVPKLLARGEAARRAKDIPGAADDFNRALAFAPNDLAILKRVTSLTSSASRRLLLKRAGTIAVGSAALGLAAFGVVRYVRSLPPPVELGDTPVPPLRETSVAVPAGVPTPAESIEGPADVASAAPTASARRPRGVGVDLSRILGPAPSSSASAGPPGTRNVSFAVNVLSARLTLDGTEKGEAMGLVVPLSTGTHTVKVTVPNSNCCDPLIQNIQVSPGDPSVPEKIRLHVTIRPASVLFRGPTGGSFSCPVGGAGAGTPWSGSVKLPQPVWGGTCTFTTPEGDTRRKFVELKAGESNVVTWPD